MKIKRQEAFDIAIEAIRKLPASEKNIAAIEYLESARSERYIKWSKDKIIEAMYAWQNEHGRSPNAKDLKDQGLPSAGTIKSTFDMTISEFFGTYFPSTQIHGLHKYSRKTADEWIADFIIQYEALLPSSADDYDLRRKPDTPTWITIARYAGLSTWYELINLTGVRVDCLKRKYRISTKPTEWTVRSTSHFLEEYNELKKHIDEIFIGHL